MFSAKIMTRNLKQHILDIASELFYREGINKTGVDAIVKAAGTTKMSLYKYFASKDDLVMAHLQKSRQAMMQRISDVVAQQPSAPAAMLAVFDVFEEILGCSDFRGCPFINASAEFADLHNPVQQNAAEFYQDFRALLTQLGQQAQLIEAGQLADQLVMLIAGAVVSEQMQHHGRAIQCARKAAELLIASAMTHKP